MLALTPDRRLAFVEEDDGSAARVLVLETLERRVLRSAELRPLRPLAGGDPAGAPATA